MQNGLQLRIEILSIKREHSVLIHLRKVLVHSQKPSSFQYADKLGSTTEILKHEHPTEKTADQKAPIS